MSVDLMYDVLLCLFFVFFPPVKFPPCLVAASECTRAVGGLIGFVNDDTEFGGFEFTGVGDKVRELRDMLIDGDFSGLCGYVSPCTVYTLCTPCLNEYFMEILFLFHCYFCEVMIY